MSGFSQRYWVSLTDTDVTSLDRLIEQGRSRDGSLWRRYLASLLDVPMAQTPARETEQAKSDPSVGGAPPVSTAFHALDTTIAIGMAEQPSRHWRRGTWIAVAALLIIVVAFGAARLLLPAPRTAPPSTPVTAGYHTVKDPAGFRIVVPRDWDRTQIQGAQTPVVYYSSPDDRRRLQFFEVVESSPMASLSLAENATDHGYSSQPGYKALHRASGADWAELTYRYNDKGSGSLQVIDHRFRAADGNVYAIRASGPASLPLALVREPLDIAAHSFCPSGTACMQQTSPAAVP
ncbi:hypothetical protein ACIRBZ_01875 [Streptomyces sp. NPDC094038]|uniref:hypothetical protein n=1 Tax=Streptomyces sp. NPDC094038 TaxID=3366055 RepID=UPI00382F96C2